MRKNKSKWFKVRAGLYIRYLGDRIVTAERLYEWTMTIVHLQTQEPRLVKHFPKYSSIRLYIQKNEQTQLFDN